MSMWNYEEYLDEQIKRIKDLQAQGRITREILDMNEFCFEAMKSCGLPLTYLIPKAEGQEMDLQEWDTHTSCEHKWEYYDVTPFGNRDERDRVMLGLIYSAGLRHLLEILPQESKCELIKLVNDENK